MDLDLIHQWILVHDTTEQVVAVLTFIIPLVAPLACHCLFLAPPPPNHVAQDFRPALAPEAHTLRVLRSHYNGSGDDGGGAAARGRVLPLNAILEVAGRVEGGVAGHAQRNRGLDAIPPGTPGLVGWEGIWLVNYQGGGRQGGQASLRK